MELQHYQERCLEQLEWAIQQLGQIPDRARLSRSADLIIQTMMGPWRFFHTPDHIFEVGESGDAIEVLAALFHDLVYVQVDQGISVNISRYISPFVKEMDGHLVIRDADELPADQHFGQIMQVFDFQPGQILVPTAGQNEFLSAVIAAKCLEHVLSDATLVKIAACIEATIPFRGTQADGTTPGDRLYDRLVQLSQAAGFGWSATELEEAVRRSIRVANRDVENFAYPSSADFLDNTWNLLPETNHDLANANSYTVRGYRVSLQKMEGFMHFLSPERVFQKFRGEPDDATYEQLVSRTQKNLDVARLYLGCKLLSIAVVEALSLRIGRDVPLATIMGELPFRAVSSAQLENFLPKIERMPHPPQTPLEQEVLDLLEKGRGKSSSYDIKNSPVATYIIKSIGFAAARDLLQDAKAFFKGDLASEDFLQQVEAGVLERISYGAIQVLESRKAVLSGQPMDLRVPQNVKCVP